ncbi:MAG: polyribonucleotide nucleotidyltransferase, partial [Planctomycetales bacterium]
MKKLRVEKQIGKSVLSLETGRLAKQAGGSCLVQYGETVVLTAATTGPPRPGIDFFPLTVDYRERISAAGKYPGGFIKREGRPSQKEILTSRLCDRPIRPLFPSWFRDDVQIQSIVLASDRENDSDILSMISASVALGLSTTPFQGPLGSVRLAMIDGEYVPFPTQHDLEESELDLILSGNQENVLMIEGFSRELPEDQMLEALNKAHEYVKQVCDLQMELLSQLEIEKTAPPETSENSLPGIVREKFHQRLRDAKEAGDKSARRDARNSVKEQVLAELIPDPEADDALEKGAVSHAFHDLEKQ